MAQYARPDADTSVGNWTASSGTDLFDLINDASVSDSDYISVEDVDGSPESITFSLSSVTDPTSSSDHSVVVRASEHGGMAAVTLTVELKDGSTSIKSEDFTPPSSSPSNHTMSLDSSEADDISSGGYGDLTLVITATDGFGMMTTTRVYNAYFECPDASGGGGGGGEATQQFSLIAGGAMGTLFSLIGDAADDIS